MPGPRLARYLAIPESSVAGWTSSTSEPGSGKKATCDFSAGTSRNSCNSIPNASRQNVSAFSMSSTTTATWLICLIWGITTHSILLNFQLAIRFKSLAIYEFGKNGVDYSRFLIYNSGWKSHLRYVQPPHQCPSRGSHDRHPCAGLYCARIQPQVRRTQHAGRPEQARANPGYSSHSNPNGFANPGCLRNFKCCRGRMGTYRWTLHSRWRSTRCSDWRTRFSAQRSKHTDSSTHTDAKLGSVVESILW